MDYDTTKSKNSFRKIIEDFEENNFDVLVGTQMVTKGLDFKNVTLVGVVNADALIFFQVLDPKKNVIKSYSRFQVEQADPTWTAK